MSRAEAADKQRPNPFTIKFIVLAEGRDRGIREWQELLDRNGSSPHPYARLIRMDCRTAWSGQVCQVYGCNQADRCDRKTTAKERVLNKLDAQKLLEETRRISALSRPSFPHTSHGHSRRNQVYHP